MYWTPINIGDYATTYQYQLKNISKSFQTVTAQIEHKATTSITLLTPYRWHRLKQNLQQQFLIYSRRKSRNN